MFLILLASLSLQQSDLSHQPDVEALNAASIKAWHEQNANYCDHHPEICKMEAHYEIADKKLNAIYNKIMANMDAIEDETLVDQDDIESSLRKAQRAWVDYKHAHCDAHYTLASGGTARNYEHFKCLYEVTQSRLYYLKDNYLDLIDDR